MVTATTRPKLSTAAVLLCPCLYRKYTVSGIQMMRKPAVNIAILFTSATRSGSEMVDARLAVGRRDILMPLKLKLRR